MPRLQKHDNASRDGMRDQLMVADGSTENGKAWFVYLLECADGTTYIGISSDVERRVRRHNEGRGARYTRGRRPVNLLGTIECATQADALRQEL